MKVLKLKKHYLKDYLNVLRNWGEVYGPVKQEDKYIYGLLDDLDKLDTRMLRTILPAKKFLVPPRFSTFTFKDHSYEPELNNLPNRVVFGVHPCEIHGIVILDKFFLERFPDPYYGERRRRTAILGLSCVPDDKCFAKSTNTHFAEFGFDLAFNDLDDFYLVWVGSSLGDDLIRLKLELFDEEIKQSDLQKYMEWRAWRDTQYKLNLDLTAMPDIMELNYESPLWEKLGDKCLACGACSMVCPTCPCYNVQDQIRPNKTEGKRERLWDSCMYKQFALVAGGHNFREKRSQRVRLWYTHKLKAFITEFGKAACVGCGRCIDTCPVEINVKTVVSELKGGK
ncbi:MAG: 4Fe-4S dicluster domain-containing protein [candidate division WOR-3 bacterium]|nr:4Fe-4S dicluster domain-containing protein [candidate division WOR-3 bacterium]MCX7757333.1 4Fe-4S dicluster domain-containing protein [candidate division WOR-3 bacterium]MDW7988100.1 4Fe-4S dicluster domain-containing protein [candidate division WOR-3 bacterium]